MSWCSLSVLLVVSFTAISHGNGAPNITALSPLNITLSPPDPIELKIFTDVQNPELFWFKLDLNGDETFRGEPNQTMTMLPNGTTVSLWFSTTDYSTAGSYTLIVISGGLRDSVVFLVDTPARDPPIPVNENRSQLAYRPLRLECLGQLDGEQIQWYYMNEPIELLGGDSGATFMLPSPDPSDSGIYECRSAQTRQTLTVYDVTILPACPMGFLFPIIEFNKSVSIPCETFHRNFSRFKEVTRYCGEEIYDDFSQCTLKANSNNYIIFVQFQAQFRPPSRLPGQPINETGLDVAEASSRRLRNNFQSDFDSELSYDIPKFNELSLHQTTSSDNIEIVYSFIAPGFLDVAELRTNLSRGLSNLLRRESGDYSSAAANVSVVEPSSYCDCFTTWGDVDGVRVDQFCKVPPYIEETCTCTAPRNACRTQFTCNTGLVSTTDIVPDAKVCAVDLDSDGVPDSRDMCIGCCPEDVLFGLTWPQTAHNAYATLPCSSINPSFTSSSLIRRRCGSQGSWERGVNFDTCTFDTTAQYPVILYTVNFYSGNLATATNTVEDFRTRLLERFESDNISVTIDIGSLTHIAGSSRYTTTYPIVIQENDITLSLKNSVLSILGFVVGRKKRRTERGITLDDPVGRLSQSQGFSMSNNCTCSGNTDPIETANADNFFKPVCTGQGLLPCTCENVMVNIERTRTICMCSDPYVMVGNDDTSRGIVCSLDSDGDGVPDERDDCVDLYSPDNMCEVPSPQSLVGGCPSDVDNAWGYTWPATPPGFTAVQRCQNPPVNVSGVVSRKCREDGTWAGSDTTDCTRAVYREVATALRTILEIVPQVPLTPFEAETIQNLTNMLLEAASDDLSARDSIFPANLEDTTDFISNIARLAGDNQLFEFQEYDILSVVALTSDLLEAPNAAGWQQLNDNDSPNGPPTLLQAIERLSRGIGTILRTTRESTREFGRRNVVITAFTIEANNGEFNEFEADQDNVTLTDTDFNMDELPMLQIPGGYLREVDQGEGIPDLFVPVVYTVVRNIDVFLPRRFSPRVPMSNNTNLAPATTIFSAQVGLIEPNFDSPTLTGGSPINIILPITAQEVPESSESFSCSFWNFTEGGWDSDRVTTTVGSGNTQVTCSSTHLTSFTVLVDSSGTTPSPPVALAFSILTYIGCAISIVCLILTIIFLLTLRKEIINKVNNFVLLNLSVALLCALIIFVSGIQTATWNVIPCTIVSALLHYFFLASFSWMLCEGVLIYNLLVTVFGVHRRRWLYFYSALGWGFPVPILIITLASRWGYYYIRESTDHTSELYHVLRACWLSSELGVIWAFIVPMLAIIIVNIILLSISMYHLYKSRFGKSMQKLGDEDKKSNRKTAKQLTKAIVILMPLMGATWAIGLFAVSAHPAFYIFSIAFIVLNTLQGVGIFFFHVVRHDKIWSKLTFVCLKIRGKEKPTTGPSSNQSGKTKSTKGSSPAASTRSKSRYDTSSIDKVEEGNLPTNQGAVPEEKIELEHLGVPDPAAQHSRSSLASIGDNNSDQLESIRKDTQDN